VISIIGMLQDEDLEVHANTASALNQRENIQTIEPLFTLFTNEKLIRQVVDKSIQWRAIYASNDCYQSSYFSIPTHTSSINFLIGQINYPNIDVASKMSIGGSAAITAQPTPIFSTATTYDRIGRAVSTSATRNHHLESDQDL
jgi:hypothetical protein